MSANQFRINLNLWSSVMNPMATSLVLGEEKTLTDAEVRDLDDAMRRADEAKREAMVLVQTARDRFRAQLKELRAKPTRR